MKILQKLKFMFARKDDMPTEMRPDDMTSKKGGCGEECHVECSEKTSEKNQSGNCGTGCDCE